MGRPGSAQANRELSRSPEPSKGQGAGELGVLSAWVY